MALSSMLEAFVPFVVYFNKHVCVQFPELI